MRVAAVRVGLDRSDDLDGDLEHLASRRPGWHRLALCRGTDPDRWFPGRGAPVAAQRLLCRSCPARVDCFAASLTNHEKLGIWGGLSERERRMLRRDGELRTKIGPPPPADVALDLFWCSAVGRRCA